MNRWLSPLVFSALLAGLVSVVLLTPAERSWAGVSRPAADAAVFEMKYRGLTGPDDPLRYPSYWGFGTPDDGSDRKDPFVQAVQSRVKESTLVYNRPLPQANWALVELQDKKPVAFYFDLNADGKLSENEKFPPVASAGARRDTPYVFITSDFTLRTQNQREVPLRLILAALENSPHAFQYMWSPGCVLEGQALLAGEPTKLVLSMSGFSGLFAEFGLSSYSLFPAGQKLEGSLPRSPLSSLIRHRETFYRLKLEGTYEKNQTLRVVLEKDTRPTGQLAVTLQGKEALQARVGSVTLNGASDNSIYLKLPQAQASLPEGRYRLSSGTLHCGAQKDSEWRIAFDAGAAFEIQADQTRQVDVGGLTLSVRAMDERDRGRNDVKERTTFARGTALYLALQIKGKAGEIYTRFMRRDAEGNGISDVKPHVAIMDANEKLVVSADLEYG